MASLVKVEVVSGDDELMEYCEFADQVNAGRAVYWPAMPDLQLALLKGEGAEAAGRSALPLIARVDGRPVARAVAVVDQRYVDLWAEALGHIIMFEALPGTLDAVQLLMNEACSWLRDAGMSAVRCGFGPNFDMPFLLDSYDSLPPLSTR